MKYDLSIILPGIRPDNWERLYDSARESVGDVGSIEGRRRGKAFELIIISPYEVPAPLMKKVKMDMDNIKYIKDFGSPSRCVQLGSTVAEGKCLCWMSDDGYYLPYALEQCIQLYENGVVTEKDGITLKYKEGGGDDEYPDDYWRPRYHTDLRLPGVKEEYTYSTAIGMYNTNHFRWIGGLDCRWEHINMCTHDLAFRIQNGGKIILSPVLVARFYWSWITADSGPVQSAYFENDYPLFKEVWSKDQSNRIRIDYDNWKRAPERWKRRFG